MSGKRFSFLRRPPPPPSNTSKEEMATGQTQDDHPASSLNSFRIVRGTSDNSVIYLSTSSAESLGLQRGDTVNVKAKRRRDTVLIVVTDDTLEHGCTGLANTAKYNLRVRDEDFVTITPCPDIKYAKRVAILPVKDSIQGVTAPLFKTFLGPYFLQNYRPVVKGDYFTCQGGGRVASFKVVEVDPLDRAIVHSDTVIYCEGNPIEGELLASSVRPGYDKIAGYHSELAELRTLVELPISRPDLYQTTGIQSACGVILWGPAGIGKRYMIRALVDETEAFYFTCDIAELMQMPLAEASRATQMMFREVKEKAPAILCINNIDRLGAHASGLVANLASHMKQLQPSQQVVVIGTAIHLSNVDRNLRGYGRFDNDIRLDFPDLVSRLEILRHCTQALKMSSDVSLDDIAARTDGFVASDLASLCSRASRRLISRDDTMLYHFDNNTMTDTLLSSLRVSMSDFQDVLKEMKPDLSSR